MTARKRKPAPAWALAAMDRRYTKEEAAAKKAKRKPRAKRAPTPMLPVSIECDGGVIRLALPLRLRTEGNAKGSWKGAAFRAKEQRKRATTATMCALGSALTRHHDAALFRGRAKRTLKSDKRRGVTYAMLAEAMAPALFEQAQYGAGMLPCIVTITRVAPRRMDRGDNINGSAKHVRDGIADALAYDDGGDLIEWRYAQEIAKAYGVRVTIAPRGRIETTAAPRGEGVAT